MNRLEKAFVIFYWVYMAIYVPTFIAVALTTNGSAILYLLPFHFFGMLLGLVLLYVIFRDLYERRFEDPNDKVTWTLAILLFWPSIFVYLYRHGFRKRSSKTTKRSG